EINRCDRMHDVGCEALRVGPGLACLQRGPVRVAAFAETRDDADAGDPGFARGVSHVRQPCASAVIGNSSRAATSSMLERQAGFGNSMTRKVISALQVSLPLTLISASVTA